MYIIVVLGEFHHRPSDVVHPKCHVVVNPNCPIRIIYDFIRKSLNIPHDFEFDLCDEDGNLMFIHEKEPWIYGLQNLVPKSTYFVVLFQRDEEKRLVKPWLNVPDELRRTSHQVSDMMLKINKQLNPSLISKSGGRIRS